MDTIKVNKGNTRMIAHRGLSGLECENTAAAFVAAGQRSYYGIETDVHVTADGKFILFHDDDLKRMLGLDKEVEKCTFAELRALRFKDIDGTPREDLCMPSLEEYISICKKYEKQAILELKSPMCKEKIWEIVEIIKDMGWFARTTFISFCGQNLLYLREKYSTADAQFLSGSCTEEDMEFMIKNNFDADICGHCVTEEKVKALHAAGLKINVWTLDEAWHMGLAEVYNLEFVTTNILE